MNKQELIEKLKTIDGGYGSRCYIAMGDVFELVEQLDEPQKVTIPQFVADWIKYCKNTGVTLVRALLVEEIDLYNYANQKDYKKLKEFLKVKENQEIFARAWLDGYELEKEKRYLVKMKGVNDYGCYLNKDLLSKKIFFGIKSRNLWVQNQAHP